MVKITEIYTEKFMKMFPKPHYLLNKDIEQWDEYDWVNYRNIIVQIIKFGVWIDVRS